MLSILKPLSRLGDWLKYAPSPLNYDDAVVLDAESLTELGFREAYEEILPKLQLYVPKPAAIEEIIDEDKPNYAVRIMSKAHVIYTTDSPETAAAGWGRATYLFFKIINAQLAEAPVAFYAINAGNDLGGMFLTPKQVAEAKNILSKPHWPYIPTDEPPFYGQYH